jgi:hypothetical protein
LKKEGKLKKRKIDRFGKFWKVFVILLFNWLNV